MSTKSSLKEDDVSSESLVVPYEDINTKQKRISQERFPESILELCEKCHWTSLCFNLKGLVKKCRRYVAKRRGGHPPNEHR